MATRRPYLKGPAREAAMARAADLYRSGCTIEAVAAEMGRSYSGARKLLVDAGVTLRPRGIPRRSS